MSLFGLLWSGSGVCFDTAHLEAVFFYLGKWYAKVNGIDVTDECEAESRWRHQNVVTQTQQRRTTISGSKQTPQAPIIPKVPPEPSGQY
eukprot:2124347-Amphidinium_carterae.1